MSWVKLDDRAPEHPKIIKAGPEAAWLWVCGLAYCNRNEIGSGVIPRETIHMLSVQKQPDKLAQILVKVGLWESHSDGYRIHDYNEYQPDEAEIAEKRAKNRDRQQRHRDRKKEDRNAVSNGVRNAVTGALRNGGRNAVSNGVRNGDHNGGCHTPPDPDPDPEPVQSIGSPKGDLSVQPEAEADDALDLTTCCVDYSPSPEPPKAPPKPDPVKAKAERVIEIAKSMGRAWRKPHRHLLARIRDGATVDDCVIVLAHKTVQWQDDSEMAQYIRQVTLYGPDKWEGYIEAARAWDRIGRRLPELDEARSMTPGQVNAGKAIRKLSELIDELPRESQALETQDRPALSASDLFPGPSPAGLLVGSTEHLERLQLERQALDAEEGKQLREQEEREILRAIEGGER